MAKCSELARLMFDAARAEVKNGATTIDEIVDNMRGGVPSIDRARLVNSINEVMDSNRRTKTLFQKTLDRVKKEARSDKTLRGKIDALQTMLATGKLPESKTKTLVTPTEAIAELRRAVDNLTNQLKKSKPALAEKYEKQIRKYTDQLSENGVHLPAVKEDLLEATPELQKLRFDRDKARTAVRHKIERLKPKGTGHKVVDAINTMRHLMTTGEFSGVGRQSLFTLAAMPKESIKNIGSMFRAFANEEYSHRVNSRLHNDWDVQRLSAAGWDIISDPAGDQTQVEEQLLGRVWEWVPDSVKNTIDRFDRSYSTFLNLQRVAVAKDLMQFTNDANPATRELEDIGRVTMTLTGRLPIKSLQQHAPVFNAAFFAPWYQLSRVALLTGHPVWATASPALRKQIVTQYYGKTLASLAGIYATAAMFYGDDEPLTFDPRSSDFGKIVLGEVRIDPLSGIGSTVTFAGRAITGQTKTKTGEVQDLRGPKKKFGRADFVANFVRGKLAPGPGQAVDWLLGQRIDGSTPSVMNTLANVGVPITYGDIADTMVSDLNAPEKTALSILTMFGLGVTVHEKRAEDQKFKLKF